MPDSAPARRTVATGNKRTGRPKRLQPPSQPFLPLSPSAQPQPIELACIVHQYLLPRYPTAAAALLNEATTTLPALGALIEQRGVPLERIVAEWMAGRQKEWYERRLVSSLDGLDNGGAADRVDEGSVALPGGMLQRTVSTIVQLTADYRTLRQSEEERAKVNPLRQPQRPHNPPSISAPDCPLSHCCVSD